MNFSFEEMALLDGFFAGVESDTITKDNVISRLTAACANTEDEDLVGFAQGVISKIRRMDEKSLKELLASDVLSSAN